MSKQKRDENQIRAGLGTEILRRRITYLKIEKKEFKQVKVKLREREQRLQPAAETTTFGVSDWAA